MYTRKREREREKEEESVKKGERTAMFEPELESARLKVVFFPLYRVKLFESDDPAQYTFRPE
jgi:hypothetical protein